MKNPALFNRQERCLSARTGKSFGGIVFDWKNPLFRFGVWATGGWLAAGLALIFFAGNWCQGPGQCGLKPNEWGDVFAGLFAPVAFLWLVLGFVQQGQELQLSTKALMLQVDELKNTVEHQRQLVEVTREQLEAAIRHEKHQAEETRRLAQPRFILVQAGSSSTGSRITYNLTLRNVGATAANIQVFCDARKIGIVPSLGRDEEGRIAATFDPKPITKVKWLIRFSDSLGQQGESVFIGTPTEGNSMQIDAAPGVFA